MLDLIHIQTVGLWPLVAHYSVAFIIVGGCLAIWLFSAALAAEVPWIQPFLGVIRRSALRVAVAIVAGTICYAVGVSNGESHIKAKWDASEKATAAKGSKARADSERTVGKLPAGRVLNDTYDRDNH